MKGSPVRIVTFALVLVSLLLALSVGVVACGSSGSSVTTATTSAGSQTTSSGGASNSGTTASTSTSGTTGAGASSTIVEGGQPATDWQAQLPQLQKAAQDNPTDLTALQALAVAQYQLKKYDDAAATYEKMLAVKDDALTHNNYANVLRDAGKNDAAIAQYQKAIAGDPKLVVAYVNLAVMYSTVGDLTNADKVLSQGIAATSGDDQTRLKTIKDKLDKAVTTTTK